MGVLSPLSGYRPWHTRRIDTPALSETAIIRNSHGSRAMKVRIRRRTGLFARPPTFRSQSGQVDCVLVHCSGAIHTR